MPEKTFVRSTRYRKVKKGLFDALEALETDPAMLDRTMAAYQSYLNLIDCAFPMLLSVAEPLPLQRAPSGTYLLPPIPKEPLRYLLCLFPKTPSQPAGLRLFEWWPDWEWDEQPLRDFGYTPSQLRPPQPETMVDFDGCTLAEWPLTITPLALTSTIAVFELDYRNGTLTVMANRRSGPAGPQIQATWEPQPLNTHDPRAERISGGSMPVALYIKRQTDPEHWPDDLLLNDQLQTVQLTKPNIGRIGGVDGPADSTLRYLASNLARVFRVDLATGDVRCSARLGGKVEDILVTKSPESPDPSSLQAVLAACYDGRVYWLRNDDDESGPGAEPKPGLTICHWHPMPRLHIQRLVGDPEGRIIALDQYYRLHPLLLNSVWDAKKLRDRATKAITRHLSESGTLRRYLVSENGLAAGQTPNPKRFRLLVEIWLRAIQRQDWAPAIQDYLDEVVKDLRRAADAETETRRALDIARCHETLLQRIWGWMRNQCEGRRFEHGLQDPMRVVVTLGALCDLSDKAPDRLWLKVFREHDWLEPWGEGMKLDGEAHRALYRQVLADLRRTVYLQRRNFATSSHTVRPLRVVNSVRLRGQARHLRRLNASGQSFVCCVPSRGLSVFTQHSVPIPRWELRAFLDGARGAHRVWEGQIGAIATRADSCDGKRPPDLVFIATNRGEALLFEVKDGDLPLLQATHVPIDCYSARYLRLERPRSVPRCGFLLAGNDAHERACLVWLELDARQQLGSPHILYTSEERGRLRLGQEDPNGDSHYWAIDQIRGYLLRWSLKPLMGADAVEPLSAPEVWYSSASNLHGLYVSTMAKPRQVVCGSHDGSVVALCREIGNEGRLLWSTGCGGSIRRIRRIQTWDGQSGNQQQGLWLAAGDSEDALLFDDEGRLATALERVGPVSATCRLGTGEAVIAAQSGRLIFLDGHAPNGAESNRTEFDNIAIYPLRSHERDRTVPPFEVLADLFTSDEPLIFQRGLRLISDALSHDLLEAEQVAALTALTRPEGDWPDPALSSFAAGIVAGYGRRAPPHRAALLARCSQLTDTTAAWSSYDSNLERLLECLWEGLNRRSASDMLFQIIDGVLSVSELRALNKKPAAAKLTASISDCLWGDTPADNCPTPMFVGSRLRLLRLGQAARAWQVACQPNPVRPTPIWADTLALLWGTDDPRRLVPRFTWLADSRLPFQGFKERERWLDFFGNRDAPRALAELGLGPLQAYPREGVLAAADMDQLCAVFPDNTHWSIWLDGLVQMLNQVRAEQRTGSDYRAWQERDRLASLKSHIDGADSVLTARNGLTLARLFWYHYRGNWTLRIDEQVQALDENLERNGLGNYLDIERHFTWQDSRHVRIRLLLRNRSVRALEVTRLQHADHLITGAKRNVPVAASDDWSELQFDLEAETDNELNQSITLYCHDDVGGDYTFDIQLKSSRSLDDFNDSSWWPERACHLKERLDLQQLMVWLPGPWWPEDEHRRLSGLIRDRFAEGWASIRDIHDLAEADGSVDPICVPDLKPGEQGLALASQFHALLHQHKGLSLSLLALALWVRLRGDTPRSVNTALAPLISSAEFIRTLLRRLFWDRSYENLQCAIANLDAGCLVAWCTGELLVSPDGSPRPGPGSLGFVLWQRLLDARLPEGDLAAWLVCSSEVPGQIASAFNQAKALLMPSLPKLPTARLKSIVAPLLAVLADSEPALVEDIGYAEGRIDLLHQTLTRAYVLLPGQTPTQDQLGLGTALWLLVNRDRPADLCGVPLKLGPDDLLVLLCARDPRQALQRLNQLAAVQRKISPERVFQTAHGLDAERMDRAFHGRDRELNRMRYLLDLHEERVPNDGAPARRSASALLVGGRRMGKTTLMQRIERDLILQHDDRPWIEMVCLEIPKVDGNALLHWFIQQLRSKLKKMGERARFHWKKVDDQRQRQEAVNGLKDLLTGISAQPGKHKVVVFLDETHHLLERDTQGHHVANLLRELVQANLISLIATTYPHGTEKSESLYKLAYADDPDNPWYNLFDIFILEPWSPETTWEFLQTRLNGFGILLPEPLAGPVLHACRGVPWIAHGIGLSICNTVRHRQRILTQGDWEVAQRSLRDQVLKHFKETVAAVAEQADRIGGINPYSEPRRAFGLGHLWDALSLQAGRGDLLPVRYQDTAWPAELPLDADEVVEHFKDLISTERVIDALDRLSHTGLLVGGDGQHFRFCNNLFPAYVRFGKRK